MRTGSRLKALPFFELKYLLLLFCRDFFFKTAPVCLNNEYPSGNRSNYVSEKHATHPWVKVRVNTINPQYGVKSKPAKKGKNEFMFHGLVKYGYSYFFSLLRAT